MVGVEWEGVWVWVWGICGDGTGRRGEGMWGGSQVLAKLVDDSQSPCN